MTVASFTPLRVLFDAFWGISLCHGPQRMGFLDALLIASLARQTWWGFPGRMTETMHPHAVFCRYS